jgi:hypothetical protein
MAEFGYRPGPWQELARFASPDLSAGNIMGPIDYGTPLPRQPYGGMPGQFAGPAPTWTDRAAGYAGQAGNIAGEMTGVPAAGRAGTALAEGDYARGAGEALMALPSRMGSIVGFPLASAEAQQPDPRRNTIKDLDAQIAANRAKLEKMATTNYRSTVARQAATKPYEDENKSLQTRRDALQGQIDEEFRVANDQRLASERGAQWANTPFAKKYPGAPAGLAGVAAIGSLAFPIARGRRAVTAFERDAQSTSQRVSEAVGRANDTSLSAKVRQQAANEARQLQTQYEALRTTGPATGGHGRAFLEGAVPMEAAVAAPSFIDYLSSTPGSELRDYTIDANNPVAHPGEVLSRYGIGAGFGGVLGELGHLVSDRLANPGTDYGAEVRALNKRYSEPRKAAPRKRK